MRINEPCQEEQKGKWGIEARAFPISYTPFTHNFWTLVNSEQIVVDQLHGLAVDPETGATQAVGNSRHLLQVIHRADLVWALQPNQSVTICANGLEPEICRRWQAALNAIPAINALQLSYPNWWQHAYKANSNTVFNTLGQIMGFSKIKFLLPTIAPGIDLVISQEIIEKFHFSPAANSPESAAAQPRSADAR